MGQCGRRISRVSWYWSTQGTDHEAFNRRLRDRKIAASCRRGRIRISPHCYNNADDLERLENGACRKA